MGNSPTLEDFNIPHQHRSELRKIHADAENMHQSIVEYIMANATSESKYIINLLVFSVKTLTRNIGYRAGDAVIVGSCENAEWVPVAVNRHAKLTHFGG